MKITIKKIKPEDIDFLQDEETLYTSDFRSIGESTNYLIPAMWKYENLMGWILQGKNLVVNNDSKKIKYPFKNNFIKISKGKDPRISIYKKIPKLSRNIKKLWVAIPHPEADIFAKKNNLQINYTYSDFLLRNNKIKQKKLLRNLTPDWKIITNNDFSEFKNSKGFAKRKFGSGGFTVFDVKELNKHNNLINSGEWYFENFIRGKPYSIQCYIDKNQRVTIFGLSEQIIANGKNFIGSKILKLNKLNNCLFALKDAIKKLKPLLINYAGFFGIDFIVNKTSVSILEANIRMTAATIPTLVTNMCACDNAIYCEDVNKYENEDIILSFNGHDIDKIKLMPTNSSLGKHVYINIKKSEKLSSQINNTHAEDLSKIISKKAGPIVKTDIYNFWPHGWTLSFILKESYCVISSWFLEKIIQVDLFSCRADFSQNELAKALNKYFKGEINKIKIDKR
jgi:S-adenosylmethionine/arginine decarboxylase-like enzyme